MSCSSEIKQELARVSPEKDCCGLAELSALTQTLGSLSLQGAGRVQLKYTTDSPTAAWRILWLLRHRLKMKVDSGVSREKRFGGRFVTTVTLSTADSHRLLRRMNVLKPGDRGVDEYQGAPRRVVRRICCRRAFIRGMFLGCGSAAAPEKGYHAEFVVGEDGRARFLQRVLEMTDLRASVTQRKNRAVVYMKDSEMISRLLVSMGAPRALLRLEDVRTLGVVKQQVTRALNCDQANISKQLSSARQQVAAVTRISTLAGLTSLKPELEELARLRLANASASMETLAGMLKKPLSKSGVQHRMRRLQAIADELTHQTPTVYVKEETP